MEERSICLRFCPSSLFENALRVVVRDVCHGKRRGGLDCLVNSDRNADLFPRGVKRGKGSAWRTKWIHRGFRGTRKAIPLPREETRSTVIRLEFCPPRAKRGGKWERGRRAFPLSSRVNSRHRSLFLFEYIYMYNCRSVVTNFLFSFSLSFSFFFTHVEQMETGLSSNDAHVGKCVSTVSSSVGKGNRAIKPRHCFERNGPRKSRERSTDFMRRGHSPLNSSKLEARFDIRRNVSRPGHLYPSN